MTARRPIFVWGDEQSWLADVPQYAGSLLTPKLSARLKRSRAKCWSDDMEWLGDDYAVEDFQALFAEHYGGVRGFHGCRPISIGSYLDKGMLGQSQASILDSFRQLFSDIPAERLNKAIEALSDRGSSERGKIYFCATAETLIEECGHYLIQGSEYLMALAAALCSRLGDGEDYRMRLRKAGVPTIFEVDIPLDYLPPLQREALCRTVLSVWGQYASGVHLGADLQPCYIVHRDIEPQHIRDHRHPTVIRDPHMGKSKYHVKGAICDICHTTGS